MIAPAVFVHVLLDWWPRFLALGDALGGFAEPREADDELVIYTGRNTGWRSCSAPTRPAGGGDAVTAHEHLSLRLRAFIARNVTERLCGCAHWAAC